MLSRLFLVLLVGLFALVASKPAYAQYPERDITWIVPFSAGGGYDVWARALARSIEKDLPKNVRIIIKNVTGAGGRVGTLQLYRSRPDGYTIGVVDVGGLLPYQIAVGTKQAGYDLDQFSWIAVYAEAPWIIAVRKDSPLKSLRDVKAQGKTLRWGVLGPGETHWLTALITTGEMDLPLNIVSGYKGVSDMAPALMRGDFDLSPILSTSALEYVKSGDLRPIAVLADKRFPAYPNVLTAKEQGFPIYSPFVRLAAAPPKTPADIVKYLEAKVLNALKDPELKSWADSSGRGLEIVRPGGSDAARETIKNLLGVTGKYQKEIAQAIKAGK
jgi:tripartite-type tricarboxylate transporter receptor subunit TctC